MNVAVIGAGWAGLAAAVEATRAGHVVTLMEAARTSGGRARSLPTKLPDGREVLLDNGQHVLIGAYCETLSLMQRVGIDLRDALLEVPLSLRRPDGSGLKLPRLPAPLDAAVGIARARGWNWRDKLSLIRTAQRWQRARFACAAPATVADLCATLTITVRRELIEPLCVSALNTPIERASGQVFLRVLRDSLFGRGHAGFAPAALLLPKVDLGRCFPDGAVDWLRAHGADVRLGQRVQALARDPAGGWRVDEQRFDQVLLATAPWDAARLVESAIRSGTDDEAGMREWLGLAQALRFEAIATVYAMGAPSARLAEPMLSLPDDAAFPAQFVFDRAQLGGPPGLLAFVVSASMLERMPLEAAVLAQARAQLGRDDLRVLRTVVEKRATFACTPGLLRPAQRIASGLLACGDYVAGPYPATIEGAVRSGLSAVGWW